jgi:murein DD-endopeptidase MepM/ murein hydrolase activator NlpD
MIMDIIFFPRRGSASSIVRFRIGTLLALSCLFLFVFCLFGAGLWGYQFGVEDRQNSSEYLSSNSHSSLSAQQQFVDAELTKQKDAVEEALQQSNVALETLSLKVGELQARLLRLDTLGSRLVTVASLDADEFNFSRSPALGGPAPVESQQFSVPDFLAELETLSKDLLDREVRLDGLETVFMEQRWALEQSPRSRPIDKGWASSLYGTRTDPFNGKRAFHHGIDYAGKDGSAIFAVASGVVVWSGKRYGYGNMVEIDHGNAYATRYAHNQSNVVSIGDFVSKNQLIAHMGSSGRSTGPHVHFEVLQDGKTIDPAGYLAAKK